MPTSSDEQYKQEQRRFEHLASRPLNIIPSDVEFIYLQDMKSFLTLNRAVRRDKRYRELMRRYYDSR